MKHESVLQAEDREKQEGENPYRTSMKPRVAHIFRGSKTFVLDLREVIACTRQSDDNTGIVFRSGHELSISSESTRGLADALEAYLANARGDGSYER